MGGALVCAGGLLVLCVSPGGTCGIRASAQGRLAPWECS